MSKADSWHSDNLLPVRLNAQTGEPYIQLAPPYAHIILTPPRESDWPTVLGLLNDPRVYRWLQGPPCPYERAHADEWLARNHRKCLDVLAQLQAGARVVDACPVRSIREVHPDGSDAYLGDCTIDRNGFPDVMDLVERKRLDDENEAKEVGDDTISWSIGGELGRLSNVALLRGADYLAPSHHGQGIMTAVVKTILFDWGVPWMNARFARTSAYDGNRGSVRVFEKCGFVLQPETIPDAVEIPESKGGGKIGLHILDWKHGSKR